MCALYAPSLRFNSSTRLGCDGLVVYFVLWWGLIGLIWMSVSWAFDPTVCIHAYIRQTWLTLNV